MTAPKLYLMTTSCSGKSYFAQHHARHAGVPVVDFSTVNRAAEAGQHPEVELAPGSRYRERVIAYLTNVPGPVCVLGRKGPADPPLTSGIRYGAVLIPLAEHERNWAQRDGRSPHTSRADFADLEAKRDALRRYAVEYGVPIFDSFTGAIEALVGSSSSGPVWGPVSGISAPTPPRGRSL